jgi:hypothetical protein
MPFYGSVGGVSPGSNPRPSQYLRGRDLAVLGVAALAYNMNRPHGFSRLPDMPPLSATNSYRESSSLPRSRAEPPARQHCRRCINWDTECGDCVRVLESRNAQRRRDAALKADWERIDGEEAVGFLMQNMEIVDKSDAVEDQSEQLDSTKSDGEAWALENEIYEGVNLRRGPDEHSENEDDWDSDDADDEGDDDESSLVDKKKAPGHNRR